MNSKLFCYKLSSVPLSLLPHTERCAFNQNLQTLKNILPIFPLLRSCKDSQGRSFPTEVINNLALLYQQVTLVGFSGIHEIVIDMANLNNLTLCYKINDIMIIIPIYVPHLLL